MKKSALVPLASGFEEIEAMTIVDVLRRAGVHVVTASLGDRDVTGAHDVTIRADTTLDAARAPGTRFDAVVLPGGMPGAKHLAEDKRVLASLQEVVEKGGTAAAICAAPIALEAAGVLKGRRATAYPGFREHLTSAAARLDAHVVEDGPIVTSAGPGTAMEFALALAARLTGRESAEKVKAGLLL